MGKHLLPEEAEIRANFRKLREDLKRKIKDFEESDLSKTEVEDAICLEYNVLARLEEELEKIPRDEELELELEEFTESEFEGKKEYTRIPTTTYNKLLNRLSRLEAKTERVKVLDLIGKHSRALTQNITSQAQIDELRASAKKIEIETHHASLMQLVKVFFLTLRKLGYTDDEIKRVAREQKRLQKDYPLIQNDYESLKRVFYAEPEELPQIIDAEYEEVDDKLADVNATISKKPTRGRRK
jgi:hypothetical protein